MKNAKNQRTMKQMIEDIKAETRCCARCSYIYYGLEKDCPRCNFIASYRANYVYDSWFSILFNFLFKNKRRK